MNQQQNGRQQVLELLMDEELAAVYLRARATIADEALRLQEFMKFQEDYTDPHDRLPPFQVEDQISEHVALIVEADKLRQETLQILMGLVKMQSDDVYNQTFNLIAEAMETNA